MTLPDEPLSTCISSDASVSKQEEEKTAQNTTYEDIAPLKIASKRIKEEKDREDKDERPRVSNLTFITPTASTHTSPRETIVQVAHETAFRIINQLIETPVEANNDIHTQNDVSDELEATLQQENISYFPCEDSDSAVAHDIRDGKTTTPAITTNTAEYRAACDVGRSTLPNDFTNSKQSASAVSAIVEPSAQELKNDESTHACNATSPTCEPSLGLNSILNTLDGDATGQPQQSTAIVLLDEKQLTDVPEHFTFSTQPLLFVKISDTLSSTTASHSLKEQALQIAIDLARRPRNVQLLLQLNVFDEAVINAGADGRKLRILATRFLLIMIAHRDAKEYAKSGNLVARAPRWLIDHIPEVRANAALLLTQLVFSDPSALLTPSQSIDAPGNQSLLSFVISKLRTDRSISTKANLIPCITRSLRHKLCRVVARYHQLLVTLKELTSDLDEGEEATSGEYNQAELIRFRQSMVAAACECIAEMALFEEDQQQFHALSVQGPLSKLLALSDQPNVRYCAATALMQATVYLPLKIICVTDGTLRACMDAIVRETEADAFAVLLQLLSNLAESPAARIVDNAALTRPDFLNYIESHPLCKKSERVMRSAQLVLQKIRRQF